MPQTRYLPSLPPDARPRPPLRPPLPPTPCSATKRGKKGTESNGKRVRGITSDTNRLFFRLRNRHALIFRAWFGPIQTTKKKTGCDPCDHSHVMDPGERKKQTKKEKKQHTRHKPINTRPSLTLLGLQSCFGDKLCRI